MSSLRARLAAVNELLESGREENLKVAENEAVGNSESNDYDTSKLSNTSSTAEKQRPSKRKRSNNLSTVDLGSADEADEENDDERLRSMKRRSKAVSRISHSDDEGIDNVKSDDKGSLVYGGIGHVSEDAVDNMVNELKSADKRRAKYRRQRGFDEDNADITFINEGNRLFNRTLDRHFDKFESVKEIKDNLERGTA